MKYSKLAYPIDILIMKNNKNKKIFHHQLEFPPFGGSFMITFKDKSYKFQKYCSEIDNKRIFASILIFMSV